MARIDPLGWVAVANLRKPQTEGLTEWFSGAQTPEYVGWYERHFTDSEILLPEQSLQYWDGQYWLTAQGLRHHRQAGEYPAWRGLTRNLHAGQEIVLVRGSRGRPYGPGCERRVRARLVSATPYNVIAELLEDDPDATTRPTKAGEQGVWHGLSFID